MILPSIHRISLGKAPMKLATYCPMFRRLPTADWIDIMRLQASNFIGNMVEKPTYLRAVIFDHALHNLH
jgi:hypothetical protein